MTRPLKLNLDRPLAVFDIEATGTSPRADRIVELAIVKVMPKGLREAKVRLINPGIPIPADAAAIHGITDADIADCPRFGDIAEEVFRELEGCDLCGYNVLRYDIPMLTEEFLRAGIRFDTESRRIVDVQRIFHRREPRDLTAALAFYCGEMHIDAHGAEADVLATIRVLESQIERYSDLPRDMEALDAYCNPRDPSWGDKTGKLRWQDGILVLNFGRKKGTPLAELVESDPGFVKWMLKSDFPADTREILQNATRGIWPAQPATPVTGGTPADD